MTFTTHDRTLWNLPEFRSEQAQVISPTDFFGRVLTANGAVPWANYTRSNLAQLAFHVCTSLRLLFEPRPQILPPFPRANQAATTEIAQEWAYVANVIDLPLPAAPTAIAISREQNGPRYAFEHKRDIHILPKVNAIIFHNPATSMPNLKFFIKELERSNRTSLDKIDEEFIRNALAQYRLQSFPEAPPKLEEEFTKLVDSVKRGRTLSSYLGRTYDVPNTSRYLIKVGSDYKYKYTGVQPDPILPLEGVGSIISRSTPQPHTLYSRSSLDYIQRSILKSENRALSLQINSALGHHDVDQFKTNVFNVISKAAGEGLHYALWIANYELNIVYKDVGSRDRAVKSIMESSEVMAYVKKEGVKTLTGIHTKFHMCWTLPRGYMSPESLLADLKRHFAQTGYSSAYAYSEVGGLKETTEVTFLSMPPWLGDDIILSSSLTKQPIRPRAIMRTALQTDGPWSMMFNDEIMRPVDDGASNSNLKAADPSTASNASEDVSLLPNLICDPALNWDYSAMISRYDRILGGIERPGPNAEEVALPDLSLAIFLRDKKWCYTSKLGPNRIESLFFSYMKLIEDRFPSAGIDEKLTAFMRVGPDVHKNITGLHKPRIDLMRNWRNWRNMPTEVSGRLLLTASKSQNIAKYEASGEVTKVAQPKEAAMTAEETATTAEETTTAAEETVTTAGETTTAAEETVTTAGETTTTAGEMAGETAGETAEETAATAGDVVRKKRKRSESSSSSAGDGPPAKQSKWRCGVM